MAPGRKVVTVVEFLAQDGRVELTRWLPLLLLLAACGRTEPVDVRDPVDPTLIAILPDGGTLPPIEGGACMGILSLCPRGFHCEAGVCLLNGADAALQVTLQWRNTPRTADDLDLHLLEPLPVQGSCEIWYGSGRLFSCTAVGRLDLDANEECLDTDPSGGPGADTENIIYPSDRAVPKGHYIVRVDYYAECTASASVPFIVTVRNGATLSTRTGVFHAGESDSGNEGSGITVMEFDVR